MTNKIIPKIKDIDWTKIRKIGNVWVDEDGYEVMSLGPTWVGQNNYGYGYC